MRSYQTKINGKKHDLIVLKITQKDAHGRPSKATIGYDDTVFKVDDGDEFVTAWVPSNTTAKVNS